MEIMFLGPLGKVTGSCCWMRDRARGWSFLVDCGMQQGEHSAAEWNACDWPFEPAELDFVVLTHAHVDHSGLLPVLYRRGFQGPVYSTRETQEVARVLLLDAARFPEAKFSKRDVEAICWKEPATALLFGRHHPVAQDLFLRFSRSGHVIGATSVAIYWGAKGEGQKSIVFSGDLGPNVEDTETLPYIRHRMDVEPCDFAVLESTYGGVVRSIKDVLPEQRRARLRELLDRTIERGGVLAIPAFALGRTQDVLFDLHWILAEDPERYADVPLLLDSPAAARINEIVVRAMDRTALSGKNKVRPLWMGKQMCAWFGLDGKDPEHLVCARRLAAEALGRSLGTPGGTPAVLNSVGRAWRSRVTPVKDRAALFETGFGGAAVLVMGSGTGEGGPAGFWLPRLLRDARNSVAFAGYCSPSSIGGRLLALGQLPPAERRLHTGDLQWQTSAGLERLSVADVAADIGMLSGYSAHADQAGLVQWAFSEWKGVVSPVGRTVFLQHGGDEQRAALADALRTRAECLGASMHVICPRGEPVWLDLERGAEAVNREVEEESLQAQIRELEAQLRRMRGDVGS